MELIRGLHNIRVRHRQCVATVGNFDGIHLGHQYLIRRLSLLADKYRLSAVIIIFEPQPQEYFAPAQAPARLTRLREKIDEMGKLSVDRLVCLRFNQALASQPPELFVRQLLINKLAIRYLIVGDDFRFGHHGRGDYALLESMAKQCDYTLEHVETYMYQGQRISSTKIRQALANGDLHLAQQLLGRRYTLSGRVIQGEKRGRKLGFPTANVALHRLHSPLRGVYVTQVHGLGQTVYKAVTSIGNKPMFAGDTISMETHILAFDANIYARHIKVEILQKLRAEKKFPSVAELKQAMATDVEEARLYFAQNRLTQGKTESACESAK